MVARPSVLTTLDYEPAPLAGMAPDGLYVLRGPRRVGKSLEAKRAIARLIRRGVEPRLIIHFAGDELQHGDLRRLVNAGPEVLTRGRESPRYWFLNEITSVVRAAFGAGVLATRSLLQTGGDVWAVPAPLIAWMLND